MAGKIELTQIVFGSESMYVSWLEDGSAKEIRDGIGIGGKNGIEILPGYVREAIACLFMPMDVYFSRLGEYRRRVELLSEQVTSLQINSTP